MLDNKAFGERLLRLRHALGKKQEELASSLDTARAHWSRIEHGQSALTLDKLYVLMHLFNVNPAWLMSGRGPMFLPMDDGTPRIGFSEIRESGPSYNKEGAPEQMVSIPILSTVAALGSPIQNEHEQVVDQALLYRPKVPHPKETFGLRVRGDSMYPTLQDGFLVFVDRHPDALRPLSALDRKLVVVRLDHGAGGISIKRLRVDDNGLLVTADHPAAAFKPVALTLDEAGRILAKVIGWWGEQ
jgi:SOS-response transcriptional repressor LexA